METLGTRKRWESKVVRLEVLSPLVVRREARSDAVEMRMPSLKGMLRFWWRALQGHATSLKVIHEREKVLFGAAGSGKSPLRLALVQTPNATPRTASEVYLPPHKKEQKFQVAHFPPGSYPFQVRVTAPADKLNVYVHLLRTALVLGGLGARSRRGFGSLHMDPPPTGLEDLCAWMNKAAGVKGAEKDSVFVVEERELSDKERSVTVERIVLKRENPRLIFPYVQEVYLGAPLPADRNAALEWVERVGHLSSRHHSLYTGYAAPDIKRLGNLVEEAQKVRQKRLASPLVVTLARFADGPDQTTLRPVVVRLKTVFPKEIQQILKNQKNLSEHQRVDLLQDTTNSFILDVLEGGRSR